MASAFNQPLSFDTSSVTRMTGMFAARPTSNALLPTGQYATAFNQPLSFDTSSVTEMSSMFAVRFARALAPSLQLYFSWALPAHAACATATPRPLASRPAPRPTSHALLPTWQYALAFNQPLSFDTSSVTRMTGMFAVRSAPTLAPSLQLYFSWALPVYAACVTATTHALSPPGPHLVPHRMPSFRLGSTRRRSTSR